ncbi:cyclic pyranopterin monophosphate synthase MoaC [Wansuia hejianensis]|uniref:Cyclic pyranopterin monophosphate synthase n=1 Tax=Wansuia hejianensis TaxID=2763667 RepID=A0A926F334_9FIRM|nr:cyclic pyranopterin monophosphate synthase MoaC [Wansuia hejianensis]
MEFTHFNKNGRAHMVEVGDKEVTKRIATASGKIIMKKKTLDRIKEGQIKKGDVLSVSEIAGIMGAKQTSNLIPMCHNIFLSGANIDFNFIEDGVQVQATVKTEGKTGVEMEALTAVSIACLTIYDMCKAIDKDMIINDIKLIKKSGGKSGDYVRKDIKGKVLSVNISDKKGVIKKPIKEGVFIEEFGLENDAHGGNWHRQVSLLAIESFEKMKDLGIDGLVPGIFAENITTEGIELFSLPIGTRFKIGETIQELTQIGKECHTGCEISKKVGKCVMPKEGIFTKIIKGGVVREGDPIEVI